MAQQAETTTNHVAIRIDDEDGSCCAVCMEPSEWVIVGACGHREVCLYCAVCMRFFQDDRRCCICRALCATVVVIAARPQHQQQVVDDDDDGHPVFDGTVSRSSAEGTTTHYSNCWWYHGGMAAYFDDRAAYEAARNMCSKPLPSPLLGVGGNKHHRAPHQDPNTDDDDDSKYLALMALVGALGSIPMVMHYLKNWLPRVAVVIASGLFTLACAYFDLWRRS